MHNTTPTHTTSATGTAGTNTYGTSNNTAANSGAHAAQGIKGVFAKTHGIGESIRGNVNSALDGLSGDANSTNAAKNNAIAHGGESEFRTGQFAKRGTTDKAL